ncbi:unnamed protein product [Penicillium manginii]
MSSKEARPTADANKDQLTINTEARDAITDLFPNIPQNDLHQIIKTAFQKGQRKVGTASELPLARRAQLAVVAHIRHLYTDYDKLLKSGSFHEARSTVEQPTLAKLVAWRGDDENGQKVLEDVFREVIVISDDDDDSEIEEEVLTSRDNRDQSVEILSSHARAHDIQTQPINFVNTSTLDPLREMSEEAPPGFRFVHTVPKKAVDRRGFSRYQAWNRAMTKYGTNGTAHGTEQARLNSVTAEQQSPRHGKRPLAPPRELADSPRRRELPPPPLEGSPRVIPGHSRFENTVHRTAAAPERPAGNGYVGIQDRRGPLEGQRTVSQQHGTSGRPVLTTQNSSDVHLLDRSPRSVGHALYPPPPGKAHLNLTSNARPERIPTSNNNANSPVFVNAHKELHSISQNQFGARTEAPISHATRPNATSQDYVLPSIEAPWPQDKRKADVRLENMTKRMSLRSVTPKQPGELSQPGSPDDPNSKRRRLAYHVPPPVSQESRPDPWNTRPIAMPVSVSDGLAARGQYRRDDLGPEYRVMDGNFVHRDYLVPADPYQRERQAQAQAPQDARPALDRTRFADMHSQSGPPGTSGMVLDDRILRTGPVASSRPTYYGDRSPHTRPAVIDPRAWKDGDSPHSRPHVPGAPLNGKLYADGFVRHVDFREVRPVEYYVQRPRVQPQPRAGDPIGQGQGQPFRARIPEHFISKDLPPSHSLPQPLPEQQHLLPASRATHSSHDQTLPHPEAMPMSGNRQPRGPPPAGARDRRPGSGPGPKRRVHDPRAFQMAEQSRPIYVQRVESQTPQPQSMTEGSRPVVIVD